MADELAQLRAELESELSKRSRIREQQLASYANGTATRRRTTTRNANADWCNDRIISLRAQIRQLESQFGQRPSPTPPGPGHERVSTADMARRLG